MKVTEIEAVSKSRAKVYIDEKFALYFIKGNCVLFKSEKAKKSAKRITGTFWRRCCPNVQNAAP